MSNNKNSFASIFTAVWLFRLGLHSRAVQNRIERSMLFFFIPPSEMTAHSHRLIWLIEESVKVETSSRNLGTAGSRGARGQSLTGHFACGKVGISRYELSLQTEQSERRDVVDRSLTGHLAG